MITDRDIVVRVIAERRTPDTVKVQDAMSAGVLYCYDDQSVEEAARKRTGSAVADSQSREAVGGIVSLGDVAVKIDQSETAGKTLEG